MRRSQDNPRGKSAKDISAFKTKLRAEAKERLKDVADAMMKADSE